MTRVMIFIDGHNLYRSVGDLLGSRRNIDYKTLSEKLTGEHRQLIRAYYYDSPPYRDPNADFSPEQSAKQRVLAAIEALPFYRVVLGKSVLRQAAPHDTCPNCGARLQAHYEQKGVDVQLAVDMVRLALRNAFDTAILVSGDSDFVSAVQVVQDQGKQVEIAFPSLDRSRELRDTCDDALVLTREFMLGCLMNPPSD